MAGGTIPFGCGQCLPCRVNRNRLWMSRQILESFMHDQSCFLTLTYSAENLPASSSLRPVDTTNFLKRFRLRLSELGLPKIRYFLVGEYGSETQRPHYHLSVFGCGPHYEKLIEKSWGLGHIQIAEFNEKTARYVCGYVIKKMTAPDDPRLDGRYPEFARMSKCPGIGATAMKVIAETIMTDAGTAELRKTGDVPYQFRMQGKLYPIGKYLRSVLRSEIGMPDAQIALNTQKFYIKTAAEMLPLYKSSIDATEALSNAQIHVRKNLQGIRSVETRSKIHAKKETL